VHTVAIRGSTVAILQLMDTCYPEQSVTLTSTDPSFITPSRPIKFMLRQNNKLKQAGRVHQAAALAVKIGNVIKRHNSAELSRVDVETGAQRMWAKVRELIGRSKSSKASCVPTITANNYIKRSRCISFCRQQLYDSPDQEYYQQMVLVLRYL